MNNRSINKGVFGRFEDLVRRATDGQGERCVLFLDTGAIIDFEREMNLRYRYQKDFPKKFIYGFLRSNTYFTFVTRRVFKEVEEHHDEHCHNGYKEICLETLAWAENFNKDYRAFTKQHPACRNFDQIRYDVHWASLLAFNGEHKKSNHSLSPKKDPISITDRDLISAALASGYSGDVTGVTILSPDKHITETTKVLIDKHPNIHENYMNLLGIHSGIEDSNLEFGYSNIKVINSRSR